MPIRVKGIRVLGSKLNLNCGFLKQWHLQYIYMGLLCLSHNVFILNIYACVYIRTVSQLNMISALYKLRSEMRYCTRLGISRQKF